MNTHAPIHIFRPGQHTDASGKTLAFSELDLEASAKAYDPALFEAPLVVGHPQLDAPAYGWVASLSFSQSGLAASPRQVDPAFAELVRAGRYKKISASFYLPNSPANPAPGVFYLRHVGFLGAAAPAVKGLKPVAFAQAEEGVVEFSADAWAERQNASLWRSLREWLLAKFGQEEADRAVPSYQVETVEDAAREELRQDLDKPAFAEGEPANPDCKPNQQEVAVDQKDKAALDAERVKLADERAKLDQEKADFAEREARFKQAESGRIHAEHVAFAESLVKQGKLLPANKAATVGLLDNLAATEAVLEFAEEGGARTSKSALAAMKDMLSSVPPVVDFGERATGALEDGAVSFAAPAGFGVDAERLALHNKALAHQAAHPGTDYSAALAAVGGN